VPLEISLKSGLGRLINIEVVKKITNTWCQRRSDYTLGGMYNPITIGSIAVFEKQQGTILWRNPRPIKKQLPPLSETKRQTHRMNFFKILG
ncbi:18648_t:CDS:2, partial [Entrophospora sp. SA101]